MFWFLIFVLIFVLILRYILKVHYYWTDIGIKYLAPWLIFKEFNKYKRMFGFRPATEQIQKLYFYYPDEKCVGVFQLSTPTMIIRDLNLLKAITIKEFDHFMNHRVLLTEDFAPLFGKNLVSLTGSRFALLEIKALCVSLLSKFDICVTEKTDIPLKLSWKQLNLIPNQGIWLGLKSR